MRSTRLPGKMLADVGGKPLVAWVAGRARASGAARVVIAADHRDIARAPIPYPRDAFAADRSRLPQGLPAYRHIGIYAYGVEFLARYATLAPTDAERFEALEQLRALGHGHRIAVAVWDRPIESGVDT